MNFLIGKVYWEFITSDEKEPFSHKTSHNNKLNLIKVVVKKLEKSYISFLWMCPVPWLCIFKMQNHPSKFGIHWLRCITLIHKFTKCNSSKSCIIYKKNKMNISDYSTKAKNLVGVLASIGTLIDDQDLVAMTLNGLGKNYI